MSKVLVLGGNFAGLTAALEVKRKLADRRHTVKVVSLSDKFLFIPSLIWVPFREREISQITRPLEPIFRRKGVEFENAEALSIDPLQKVVKTTEGEEEYDYLVIATGAKFNYGALPGSDPKLGHNHAIHYPGGAMATREAFDALVADPGPAVVAAAPGASCMGAAYEFLFNLEYNLRKAKVRKQVDLYWITPEPYAGHFGIDGVRGGKAMLTAMLKALNIKTMVNTAIASVDERGLTLASGELIESKFNMIMPAFTGQDVIPESGNDLGNEAGFIPVNGTYQHQRYPHIFAAGVAINVTKPFTTPLPLGIPKTGFPADTEGKVVGENIAKMLKGDLELKSKPFDEIPPLCVMDAGHKEVLIYGNRFFKPRKLEFMIPNPVYDVSKRMLEKYFLAKAAAGLSQLP